MLGAASLDLTVSPLWANGLDPCRGHFLLDFMKKVRCPYCIDVGGFKEMTPKRSGFRCEKCGHEVEPNMTDFRCYCPKCRDTERRAAAARSR